jgi:hypothetical protein
VLLFLFLLFVAVLVGGVIGFLKLASFPTPPTGAMTVVLLVMIASALVVGGLAEKVLP